MRSKHAEVSLSPAIFALTNLLGSTLDWRRRRTRVFIELPHIKLESLKDFGKHYLLIVLSILTALGLDAWIAHTHHVHAAATASTQIDREIRQNLASIAQSETYDLQRMQALDKLSNSLERDIQAKLPATTILQHVHASLGAHGLYLDLRNPTLRHEAWDVAVANQSAGWIDDMRLHRYSAIYAAQAHYTNTMATDEQMVLDGPRMIDAMIELPSNDIRPNDLLLVVHQMATIESEAVDNLRYLATTIRSELRKPDAAPATPA